MRCQVNAFICNHQTISPPTKIFKNPQLYTTNEKNFHEQKFSLNHYVIIFQRKDFSAIFFFHVNLLNVKVYIH